MERKVRPRVLEQDNKAIGEANQEKEVDNQPGQPGEEACKVERSDIDYSEATPNRRKHSLIAIVKGLPTRVAREAIGED